MQNVSREYKKSMRSKYRNRGYIRVTIGVINSEAQKSVNAGDARNSFTYFADPEKPFHSYTVDKVYATCEDDFSHVDGTMYFLPEENSGQALYNSGIVTEEMGGTVYIGFGGAFGLDIKGLTIDFGEYYPVDFTIENDSTVYAYNGNTKRYFVTEDVFNHTSFLIIRPSVMANGRGRLRIYQFSCGIVNTFTNRETRNYTAKEYVSSITETIPSNDVSLTVDNQNLYYSPDNPDSALAYMEVGQEVKTAFGYDLTGNGDIEWLPETTAYLKTWTADDVQAKFTATDRFDYLTGTYYRGRYRQEGISLYELAEDVLHDGGITDEREYFIDPYLKNITVYNPMPPVKHSEALQVIANAGRCALYEDRQGRIHLQASFVPDMAASVNNETAYSHGGAVLADDIKDAYAISSRDFSVVDGSLFFMPEDEGEYLSTGYISESLADGDGFFGENPKITITLEAAFVAFGLFIRFRNTAPLEFHVITYYEDIPVRDMMVQNPDTEYVTYERFDLFDRMEIVFTRGYPDARITVDNVLIGDVTDYVLGRKESLNDSPTAIRQGKVKAVNVIRSLYSQSPEEIKELAQEEIVMSPEDNTCTVYFSNASYGLLAAVSDNENVSVEITDSSDYFAALKFEGLAGQTVIRYSVSGYEYAVTENRLTVKHNDTGEEIEWKNPLISDAFLAKDLEEWLASYYLGDVDYSIKWRGDPGTDANDIFYLELKGRERTRIRCYQNEIKFAGAWSGTMKARKVVL